MAWFQYTVEHEGASSVDAIDGMLVVEIASLFIVDFVYYKKDPDFQVVNNDFWG